MRWCLYHGNCWDGFGAAYAVWRRFGTNATEYRPVNYGEPPVTIPEEVDELWLLDFTYPREILEQYRRQVRRLIIIDHHVTAEAALEGFDCYVKIFDMKRSGAYLTYRYINEDATDESTPLLYDYLQDRDLWSFELPKSLEVNAYFRTFPYDFAEWVKMEAALELDFDGVVREGAATLRLVDRTVEMMCRQVRGISIAGHRDIPTVNAAAYWSETGHRLLEIHRSAPFICMYFDRSDGQRNYSLRSREDFDCSAVAKLFGGGGHRKSAGFVLPQPPGGHEIEP